MVALKRDRPPGAPPGHGAKQERRGGIETVSNSRVWAFISLGKQERRGGIETLSPSGSHGSGSPKQERRGGIETVFPSQEADESLHRSRNAVVALKRHRLHLRVGLESREAGTPWWH